MTHARHRAVPVYEKAISQQTNKFAALMIVPPLLVSGTAPLTVRPVVEHQETKTSQIEPLSRVSVIRPLNVHDPINYHVSVKKRNAVLASENVQDFGLKTKVDVAETTQAQIDAQNALLEAQKIEAERLEQERIAAEKLVSEKAAEDARIAEEQKEEAAQEVKKEEVQKLATETNDADEVIENQESNGASDVLAIGEKYIGISYLYGGTDPAVGLDCSGFTRLVYKQLGIDLPRTSSQQAEMGYVVSADEAQPGDLVFMGDPVHHVAIYAGNGRILDARKTGTTIGYGNVWNESTQYRRVL